MNDSEMIRMLNSEHQVEAGSPVPVTVQGRTFFVKQISNAVRRKISDLEKEAYLLEQICKNGVNIKQAKRSDKKIRTLHSKTAAYYILGNAALFVPFLFKITWKRLDLMDSEVTYRINEAGMNNKGADFFLANWQITKAALALSTRLVGEGVKQYQERMESVENMLEKDASGVSKDNK